MGTRTGQWSTHTFTGGDVEVKVDDVAAILGALRRAEAPQDASVSQQVRGDAESVTIETARGDALVALDPSRDADAGFHARSHARVFLPLRVLLKHASITLGGHREGARVGVQLLTRDRSYKIINASDHLVNIFFM